MAVEPPPALAGEPLLYDALRWAARSQWADARAGGRLPALQLRLLMQAAALLKSSYMVVEDSLKSGAKQVRLLPRFSFCLQCASFVVLAVGSTTSERGLVR